MEHRVDKTGQSAGLRDLLAFAGPHRAAIAGALALGLLGALAALAQPLLVGAVLKAVRTGGSVLGPAALLVALFALDAAFSGLQGYLMGRTGEGVVFGVRRALVGRLLRMTVPEHDRRRTGDLLSRVGTDTTLLKAALSQSLTSIVVGVVVFVGALVLMALIDPLLLAVALACIAVATAAVLFVATRVREATEEAQERVGTLGAALERGLAAMGRIREVLEFPVEAGPSGAAPGLNVPTAPVARLERVRFGYGPGRPVLEDVSFEIPGPGLNALVGPSGAGKSTVFALLSRFYDADSGSVRVGGTDVRHLPLGELRARVAYVEQDAPVLAGTVRQNLLYANPDASDDELEGVLDLANLRAFAGKLPDGLDTEVGDGGTLLSGGERQRTALARMLLRRPRLLLLEEVTSQLDAGNERALKETIREVSRRCAVVVIAHRLSTVVGADRILLLDRGRVSAEGTHEELLETSPLYKKLVETQMIETEDLSSGGGSQRA